MNFAVYQPDATDAGQDPNSKYPIVLFLSGLTCTEQNVITKSGFQKLASELKLAVVCPDTSPRNCNIPGEDDSWDFGTGAGFYLNATKEPFDKNYKMYDYVTIELLQLLKSEANFFKNLDTSKVSITGHSMGGHGALSLFLKNPTLFKSCSAFSPIVNPLNCPWGEKAFTGYLKNGMEEGAQYDSCVLIKNFVSPDGQNRKILIDQGLKDGFYENQLKSGNIIEALKDNKGDHKLDVQLRLHEGFDHSYYFIASFMDDHLRFHKEFLC